MYYIKSTLKLNVIQMQEKLSPFEWSSAVIYIFCIFSMKPERGGGGT
jgi:hypothetical protein